MCVKKYTMQKKLIENIHNVESNLEGGASKRFFDSGVYL